MAAADRAHCTRRSGCPKFLAHETYRSMCKGCHCPLDSHRIQSKAPAACGSVAEAAGSWSGRMQAPTDFYDCGDGHSTKKMAPGYTVDDFAWTPAGIEPETVLRYFASLPVTKVPCVGSVGERYRLEQLEWQLPRHDGCGRRAAAAECQAASMAAADSLPPPAELRDHGDSFWQRRTAEAAGTGRVVILSAAACHAQSRQPCCKECRGVLKPGDIAVLASQHHLGADVYWHPACFVCKTCRELLVDLTYFVHTSEGSITRELELYCGRHHAERLKPRCAACDEIIFADECTEAEERCWHIAHFCCFDCGVQLGGCRYVMHEARPHCCQCFERRFAVACSTCGQRIGVVQGHMMHGDTRWHATPECFRCRACSKSLLGEAFLPKADGAIFCSTQCCDEAASAAAVAAPAKDGRRAFESIGRGGSRARSPLCQQQQLQQQLLPPTAAGDERWTTEDAGSRLLGGGENFSEGYGSLRNCPSLLRRSLPDVTAGSAAESSDDDDEQAISSSRLANRRGSDKSAMSFRQQRRLAFELRRSCRRMRVEAASGKASRSLAKVDSEGCGGLKAAVRPCLTEPPPAAAVAPPPPSVAPLSQPFVVVVSAAASDQRPPMGPATSVRAAAAAAAAVPRPPHLPTSASVGSFLRYAPAEKQVYAAASPPIRRSPRMGSSWPLPPLPTTQQQQTTEMPAPTTEMPVAAGQPMQPRSVRLAATQSSYFAAASTTTTKVLRTDDDEDDDENDDDGYQEGSRCRHNDGGGVCPLCTSGSSGSSSDGEDVAYEVEVERSRGLRVARDLNRRRRTSLPQKLLARQVSAKVVQATAKVVQAKQGRTRGGNCAVQ